MSNDKEYSNVIHRRHEIVFGVVLCAFLIIVSVFYNRWHQKIPDVVVVNKTPTDQEFRQKINAAEPYDKQLKESARRLIDSLQALKSPVTANISKRLIDEDKLLRWIKAGNYSTSHHYLIEQASAAVDLNDYRQLGQIMRILAQLMASQGDLASAEVYLFEALELFEQLDSYDELANIKLLIGQMYARRRQIAQMAGWAYGDLLMARFYLSKEKYYQAKDKLDVSIHENLQLGRTGAVASAYKTMARYYRAVNDSYGEQNALVEAGKYYAHSGQAYRAHQVVEQLYQRQAPLDLIESLEQQIESRLSAYESRVNIVQQARDYMQLYSLYKSKGEHGRAWQFRVKASEILSRSDKRDMYFRMPDVMAVLYDSNFNLAKATDYYKQASDYYLSQNQLQAHQQAEALLSALN